MPTPLQNFVPSIDELNLARRLLETHTGSWNRSDTLSVDTAIGIFKQSGVSFKQLRYIWSIADSDGSGKLSKEELAVVIRLTGWVQAGEVLDERLLEKVGPLPKIKGIPDVVAVPKIDALFHPISFDEVVEFKQKFLDLKPVNGALQKRQVMEVYMDENPVLSFDELFRIMQLLNDKSGVFNFKSFALGMHIVRSPQSSLITSVPSSLFPEDYGILDDVDFGDTTLTEGGTKLPDSVPRVRTQSSTLPANVESDIHDFMKDVKQHEHISGPMIPKFLSEYGVSPSEIAQIWHQSDAEHNQKLTPARMSLTERYIGLQLAKKLSGSVYLTPLPPFARAQPEPAESLTGKFQPPFGKRPTSLTPILPSRFPSTRPLSILPTIHPTPSQFLSPDTSTAFRQYSCHNIKEEGGRLTSQLEVENRQNTTLLGMVTDAKTTITEQHKTTEPLNLRLRFLRASVRASEAAAAKAIAEAQVLSRTNIDMLEFMASACESEAAATRAIAEAQDLRHTVVSQEQEIVDLRARLEDVESAQPLSRSNIDMLDLMALAYESEAAAMAIAEAQDLRQTVLSLEQEIVELRGRLEGVKPVQALSWTNIDMLDFMASACESEAAATRAIAEAQDLRHTVLSQEQEIVELRTYLKDMERVQHRSRSNIDMLDLHNNHENLKVQVENIQCLMEQHLMSSSVDIPTSANNDTMGAEKVHGHDKTSSMHDVPPPELLHPL